MEEEPQDKQEDNEEEDEQVCICMHINMRVYARACVVSCALGRAHAPLHRWP